jgi:hypothetical protein
MNGPDLDPDELIAHLNYHAGKDYERASSAGEDRAEIKSWLEETGMNSKARSWCGVILKQLPKDGGQAKAMDIIMSLKVALPMIEAHVSATGTTAMDLKPAPASTGPDIDPTKDDLAPILSNAPEPNFVDGPDDVPAEPPRKMRAELRAVGVV